VLHSLRTELGEAAFWAGTRQYLERHGGGTVHTRHLQRAMEEASGRNLDGFFQSRVEGAGHPTVEVSLAYGEGALSVSVKQTQSGEGVSEAFHFPLSLRVVGAEGTPVERVLRVTERERSFLLPLAEEPLRVEVDAHFSTLLELTLSGPRGWLLSSLQQDPGPVGRVRAGQALLKDGSKAAITGLCAALRADTFWGVRVELAGLLGKRGGEVAEAALILALDDPHPKVRKAIVTALGGVRSRKVVEALLARAEAPDASLQVEGELIKSLGRLRAPGNLARAEAALRRDAWNDLLRSRALEALGAAQDPAALPLLLSWTSPDKGARPRAAAAAALGRLADEVESTRRPAVDALLELAREAPFRVRMAAIGGLGAAKDPRSLALLHAIHESDGDGRLARTAWNAANRVAAGRSTEAGLSTLRADLDKLRDENKALRDRLQKVEDRGTT
jgi:aminopeptidase N